jgi:hypothetical protein
MGGGGMSSIKTGVKRVGASKKRVTGGKVAKIGNVSKF